MPRYDYKTVKARHFFASRMVATDKSAYISEDINTQEVDHLLANGYRYVATREDGQDIEHVRHAYNFLKDEGRLVAVTSPAWQYRENGKFKAFRDWLSELPHDVDEVPAGAFKSSGTEIRTLIITIRK